MKKCLVIFILLFFSTASLAISVKEQKITDKKGSKIGKLVFNKNIGITYPQIVGGRDAGLDRKINSLIKEPVS